jgi:hypothetical protein
VYRDGVLEPEEEIYVTFSADFLPKEQGSPGIAIGTVAL